MAKQPGRYPNMKAPEGWGIVKRWKGIILIRPLPNHSHQDIMIETREGMVTDEQKPMPLKTIPSMGLKQEGK